MKHKIIEVHYNNGNIRWYIQRYRWWYGWRTLERPFFDIDTARKIMDILDGKGPRNTYYHVCTGWRIVRHVHKMSALVKFYVQRFTGKNWEDECYVDGSMGAGDGRVPLPFDSLEEAKEYSINKSGQEINRIEEVCFGENGE